MYTVGNQEMVRINNQRLILNLIKERGSISRADIAKTLNLSPPSTSSNISQLIEMDLIREVGEGVSIGGRRPILLELNREYGYIIGVDVSTSKVNVVIGNIYAEIMDTVSFQSMEEDSGIALLIDLVNAINTIVKRNDIKRDKLKVIIVGVSSVIGESDNRAGSYKGDSIWNDIDIVGALEMEFKAPVLLRNYSAMAAFGEFNFGIKQKCRNLLFVHAGMHIGVGLILNGELYEGNNGLAGVIGASVFSREQAGGIYRRNGYLETVVSTSKLIQRIKNSCRSDKLLLELCGNNINKLDFGVLKRAYEKNHIIIKNELDRVVDLISITIANINSLLNLDVIVLGGEMAALGEYYIISVKKMIGDVCPSIPYIAYSSLKENSTIYGILALGQQRILTDLADIEEY